MIKEVLTWLSVFSPLVPLMLVVVYRKGQPNQNLILSISLALSLTCDLISASLAYNNITTFPVINVYTILAFPAIMWFYHETLFKKSLKIMVRVFTIAFLVFALGFAFSQGLRVPNNIAWTLSSVLITITSFCFVGDLNLMNDSNFSTNPFHKTNIILNTSLALYYFVTIIMFAATDYIFSHFQSEDALNFWAFHNAVHVMKNAGVAVAFYLTGKRNLALMSSQ